MFGISVENFIGQFLVLKFFYMMIQLFLCLQFNAIEMEN
jgi:hypothetical protein